MRLASYRVRIAAPVAVVWAHLTTAEGLLRWVGPEAADGRWASVPRRRRCPTVSMPRWEVSHSGDRPDLPRRPVGPRRGGLEHAAEVLNQGYKVAMLVGAGALGAPRGALEPG